MSRLELDRVFNNTAMKKRCVVPSSRDGCDVYCTDRLIACMQRTHRFGIVAMSLSSLFDISHPTDCLRSALYVLTEYEQAKEENDRPKMVKLLLPRSPLGLLWCTCSDSGNGHQNGRRAWATIR